MRFSRKTGRGAISQVTAVAGRWLAVAGVLFFAAACTAGPKADQVLESGPAAPRLSLKTNTFPPLKYKGSTLRFAHLGLEEGLSQNSAQAIVQDAQGYLWVGTQDGLNRFDGYGFSVFRPNPKDPGALSGGEILALARADDGSVWVGTNAGLNRYDPTSGRFEHWVHDPNDPTSLINDTVQALYLDSQGLLWVGTHGGLDTFDPLSGVFRHFNMLDKPAGSKRFDSITALYEDPAGGLWIGTLDGLVRYGLADHRFQRFQNESGEKRGISFNEVCCISQAPDGILWVGTHRGLDRLDPSTGAFTPFLHSENDPGSLSDDFIQGTYVDRAGQLWVGTRYGLDRFVPDANEFVHYRYDPADPGSLSSNSVGPIYEDRGGVLWIGTTDGGLNQRDRSQDRFAYYHRVNSDPNSLSGDVVFPIVPAADGKMWIGTYDAGLNLFDPETGQAIHFRHDPAVQDSLLDDTVLSLYLDRDKTLWIGTHQGLDRLYPASSHFIHYVNRPDDPLSIPFGPVHSVYQDSWGTYYIGTARGLRVFTPMTSDFAQLHAIGDGAAALEDSAVMAIYEDRSGILWFGTDVHGLFRYNPATSQLQQYVSVPNAHYSLSSNSILSVGEDSHGTIWIGTFGGGLDRYLPDQDGFQSFRQEQGLPNDVVYGMQQDRSGKLWLSTNLGLSRFDPEAQTFENFTVADGLQSNEFDTGSYAQDNKGRLYFGGVRGLTVFEPRDIVRNPYVPPVVITALTGPDGKPLGSQESAPTPGDVTISYPVNSFNFSVAALSYSQVARHQFRYKLEGFEQAWHDMGSDHRGTYTNLPGGSYTLRVIASNGDTVWNTSGAALRMVVIPPFWQTWQFRGVAGLALLVAITFAYRRRVHGIEAQKTALEDLVMERTRALQKQNLDLQALYAADEKMLRVLSQDEVLKALADVAVDTLQADKCAVFMPDAPRDDYTVHVSRGFHPDTVLSPEFARSQQTILQKVAAMGPLVIEDTVREPGWTGVPGGIARQMASEGVRSLLYIPIQVGGSILGVFNICSATPGAFDEDRQRLFGSLVQRAALSIENSQLFQRTRHIAALEERNRLAQELHDSAKQKAFAALAQLGAAKKKAAQGGNRAAEHLDEAENIVSDVIRDLTFFIQESYPDALRARPLAAALQQDCRAWETRSGIRLYLSIIGERRLPSATEAALYRIVQEGLSNIARHSQATRARVEVVYREREVEIQIADNGSGFNRARIADGLGLRLIRERIERLGGQFEIQSESGRGTVLLVHAPIEEMRREPA